MKFERCIILVNPSSTSRHRSQTFIKQLRGTFPKGRFETIKISEQDYKDSSELGKQIASKVKAKTLLCVAGGDGTVSFAVNTLLMNSSLKRKAKDIALLPLWGGNANDLAHMANGSSRRADITKIVESGKPTPVYPLEVSITSKGHERTYLAACYTSFGTSAHAIQRMNRPSYRKRRLYRLGMTRFGIEVASVTKAVLRAKPFTGHIHGRKRRMYDIILINGSRMAKVTRGPGKLTEPVFYELRINRKHPILLMYASLFIGNRSFTKRAKKSVELKVHDGTWAQVDGEVHWVPAKSAVEVKPSNMHFNLLSTKL